jgi:uncharacterized membrane protein
VESSTRSRARSLLSRTVELALAVSGLAYTILGTEREAEEALFLALWGAVAVTYLAIGAVRVRKQRFLSDDAAQLPAPELGRRASFFTTIAASLTGLGAALDALNASDETDYGPVVTGLGVIVVVCAWLLLSLGYARFYSNWSDWRFPRTPHPQLIDFLYFSVTVGVSFAASDVEVLSRPLRWHVMVHSVLAFFYNAIVLAIAIGIVTGR